MKSKKVLTFPVKSSIETQTGREAQLSLIFGQPLSNTYVIHRAYLTQKQNKRQGSANTLTRGEVRGGGRKPWRQKGTGRARAGSNRSPLWKGGGVSFGPRPKVLTYKINRKEWHLALRTLLLLKSSNITVLESEFLLNERKTKDFIKQFKKLNISLEKNTLFIINKREANLSKSIQNIKTINILLANKLDIEQILIAKNLFITKESLKIIEETYND